MAFEQKDNSGAVFVNDKKQSDTHPDRTGTALIGGVVYFVNGWLKKTKSGQPYLSLSFKPKVQSSTEATAAGPRQRDMDDSSPF